MSSSPSGTSVSSRSLSSSCSRRARSAPRRWMPTMARRSCSGFFSTISCAMRTSVRRMSSPSRTSLSLLMAPSWPHGTGLKGQCGETSSGGRGSRSGQASQRAGQRAQVGDLDELLPVRGPLLARAVEPDAAQARRDRAVDVVAQAVADHDRLARLGPERAERMRVDRRVGLGAAQVSRDDDGVEAVREARGLELLALQAGRAVGHESEAVVAAQRVEDRGGVLEGLVARAALLAEALAELGRQLVVLDALMPERRAPGVAAEARRPRAHGAQLLVAALVAAPERLPRADPDAPAERAQLRVVPQLARARAGV